MVRIQLMILVFCFHGQIFILIHYRNVFSTLKLSRKNFKISIFFLLFMTVPELEGLYASFRKKLARIGMIATDLALKHQKI